MRFGFVTCVQLGLECMKAIYQVGGQLELAITLPDETARNKSGRIYLDEFCGIHSIPLVKSRNVNDPEVVEAVKAHKIDWLFIIGWSQIAKTDIMQAPQIGVLGMHPTLLPFGRGRAAIPWAILKGLPETGVTLFQLDEGIDTGPILAQQIVPITANENATSLYDKIADAHQALIRKIWADLQNNCLRPMPQDHSKATEWPGRRPEDGLIKPEMDVAYVDRLVRAVTKPYPGAFWQSDEALFRIWAGVIAQPGSEQKPGILRISLSDGNYDCIECDFVDRMI